MTTNEITKEQRELNLIQQITDQQRQVREKINSYKKLSANHVEAKHVEAEKVFTEVIQMRNWCYEVMEHPNNSQFIRSFFREKIVDLGLYLEIAVRDLDKPKTPGNGKIQARVLFKYPNCYINVQTLSIDEAERRIETENDGILEILSVSV